MLVVVQFYDGDMNAALSLARLMANIGRDHQHPNMKLVLAMRLGTKVTPLLMATVRHCQEVFGDVELFESPLPGEGHPYGCASLWMGTLRHYHSLWKQHKLRHEDVFMLEADTVPLHNNWFQLATTLHSNTLRCGKLITGTPYFIGTCPLHVNPNAIFNFSVFEKTRLLTVPDYNGTLLSHYDIFHRDDMLANVCPVSIVRTDWRGDFETASVALLRERSRRYVWLHGFKDADLYWVAREHLLTCPSPPDIAFYELDKLRQHEKVRRDFEAAQ